ncbi:transcriptional regulator [Rugosimonospora africana]|uniref:Transcriptional regulator n=1 Tax=Rugosimonospora africana TaxID=556532 RepID=A0A8J3QLA4_9ACTN|nr:transcriptional regulator [Rugosimonospora africana]GIH13034.1 hypothetical protein Raf01_12060 [Rugosimonospora africana]
MAHRSPTDLLVLHAVRLKGFADTGAVAARFDLDTRQAAEELLDAQAYGWATRSSFADLVGWSLTEAGRLRDESLLRDELDEVGARDMVASVHERFLPLNAEAARLFTGLQLGTGLGQDSATRRFAEIAEALRDLEHSLTAHLTRFTGYHSRFTGALANAQSDPAWMTGMEVDSCHRVWFELHEDLVATLNLSR